MRKREPPLRIAVILDVPVEHFFEGLSNSDFAKATRSTDDIAENRPHNRQHQTRNTRTRPRLLQDPRQPGPGADRQPDQGVALASGRRSSRRRQPQIATPRLARLAPRCLLLRR